MTSTTNVHGPGSYLMNTGFLLPGLSVLRRVDQLRARLRDGQSADLRRAAGYARAALQSEGQFQRGLSAGHASGHDHQSGRCRADCAICTRRRSAEYITPDAERDGLALLAEVEPRAPRGESPATRGSKRAFRRTNSRRRCSSARRKRSISLSESGADAQALRPRRQGRRKTSAAAACSRGGLIERGVRFVQVWSGAAGPTNNWDNHAQHSQKNCRRCAPRPTSPSPRCCRI